MLSIIEKEIIAKAENMVIPSRTDVENRRGRDKEFKRTTIALKANHFKVKISTKGLYQYRIDWSPPMERTAPPLKSKQDRKKAFEAFFKQNMM